MPYSTLNIKHGFWLIKSRSVFQNSDRLLRKLNSYSHFQNTPIDFILIE
jgi:hypothetical protein